MNEIECESCIKRKTIYCPSSSECYDTVDKPFYQNRIMLLEENQKLKEQLEASEKARKEAIEFINELADETDDTTCYEINKERKEMIIDILGIDKGE